MSDNGIPQLGDRAIASKRCPDMGDDKKIIIIIRTRTKSQETFDCSINHLSFAEGKGNKSQESRRVVIISNWKNTARLGAESKSTIFYG